MAILGILLALVTTYFFGEYGVAFIICIAFGLVVSMYFKQRKLYVDAQKIKIKLGIEDVHTIKHQLNEEERAGENQSQLRHDQAQTEENFDLDLSIEKELEQYEKHHNDILNSRPHRSEKQIGSGGP